MSIETLNSMENRQRMHSILLVDDSPVNLGVVVENLEMQGYEVLVAQDGEEGLSRAEIALPDIILLDVMMPGMDGFEVCRRLKKNEVTRHIPVIFMTSLSRLEDKIDGFKAGAVDYVTKPLQMDELRARIDAHLKVRELQRLLEENNQKLRREIEERKQMEEGLRAREEQYRALAENTPDPIFRYDKECQRIYANHAARQVSGRSTLSLLSWSPIEAESGDSEPAKKLLGNIRRVLATGRTVEDEMEFRSPDGRVYHYYNRYVPERGKNGAVANVLSISTDITELKKLENTLRQREQEFRTLTENSPDSIVRYDRECRFVYANPVFENLLGMPLEKLYGKKPTEVPGLLEAEYFQNRVLEVVASGRAEWFEHSVQIQGGKTKWMLLSISPERDKIGQIAHVQVLARDISALKETEKYLEESRTRFRELAMQRDSEQEEARRRIAVEVHEGIGQYLMVLRINLSMLERLPGMNGRETAERIRTMHEVLARAIQKVRKVTTELRPNVLDQGLPTALEWLTTEFLRHNSAACSLAVPEDGISMDEARSMALFRVAEESLGNISQYAEAQKVNIVLEQINGNCRLEIRDDGNGFDINLHQPGQRSGLDWMQEQVAELGGEFVVFSMPGQGTVVEVQFPLKNNRPAE